MYAISFKYFCSPNLFPVIRGATVSNLHSPPKQMQDIGGVVSTSSPPVLADLTVDCRVSNWGPCDKACGQGVQRRTIEVPPAHGGQRCEPLTRHCQLGKCPQGLLIIFLMTSIYSF